MMRLAKAAAAAVVLLLAAGPAMAKRSDLQQMLLFAESAGLCRAMTDMTRFQVTAKMEGGKEFVARFMEAEAAKIGVNLKEFIELCINTTRTYNKMLDAAGGGK